MSIRSFIQNLDQKPEVKEVETSFGKVFVKRLPYSVIKSLKENKEERDQLLEGVGLCLCESDGSICFSPDEFQKLEVLNMQQLGEIYQAAVEFNDISKSIQIEKKE